MDGSPSLSFGESFIRRQTHGLSCWTEIKEWRQNAKKVQTNWRTIPDSAFDSVQNDGTTIVRLGGRPHSVPFQLPQLRRPAHMACRPIAERRR